MTDTAEDRIKWKIETDMERDLDVKIERKNGELTINDCSTLKKMVEYLIGRFNQCQSELHELRSKRPNVPSKSYQYPKSTNYT